VGLMGHLPLADQAQPRANEAAVVQIRHARRAIMAAGFGAPLTHLAATSATLCDPATHFGMVRLGAGLVGIDPSETTELHGASRLTAPIVHSATAKAGTQVGYGGTYVTDMSTNLSVLPLGYADGIPREISSEASVEIRGRRYPVVGRVSMDQIVIDAGAGILSARHDRDRVRSEGRSHPDHPRMGPLGRDHSAHHRHRHRTPATKYNGTARFTVPADLGSTDRAALTRAALRMFDALGCDGVRSHGLLPHR
jgi:hypothetical protein